MNTILDLTPFQLRTIVERHWAGESLPSIADSFDIDRIALFNAKNENRQMWADIEATVESDHIQQLLRSDRSKPKTERDKVRTGLVLSLIRRIPKLGTNSFAFRDFIVEHLLRIQDERAEIETLTDAKEAADLFETTQGILLPESSNPKTGVYLR